MIKIDIRLSIGYTDSDIRDAVCHSLPVKQDEIQQITVIKRSLDLADKSAPQYKLSVGISLPEEREYGLLKMKKKVSLYDSLELQIPDATFSSRPIVVGSGPCGLFAALFLAESGAAPLVIERGQPVEIRKQTVKRFEKFGILDTESNVQFGEGGAGTYSDGKLKVGSPDKYKMKVLREFVSAGATEDITYSTTAHLGTDKLSDIVKNLREKIISLGGQFIYGARLTDILIKEGKVKAAKYQKDGKSEVVESENLILAIGHSAKDTIEALYAGGVKMCAKGFGIGVRIEHPREYINELVYGKGYDSRLETASYHLVTHLKNGRSVYSFCMCPGGSVVAAASENNGVVTNGMSEYLRDGENSNAAFLVSVTPSDFESDFALAGMELQRKIERETFIAGGADYKAPVITMSDFVKDCAPGTLGVVNPSYPIGTTPCRPEKCLPDYITDSLKAGIADFDDWMNGFYLPDAIITASETRSTSPVRMLRNELYEAEGISGLYPAGEGAGYSGGIVSSAVDGLRAAEAMVFKNLKKKDSFESKKG